MKHIKSTQQLAKDAADELLELGVRPTQQNVRERIGTGSITTINKALNSWWVELGQRLKAQSSHPSIPDPLAESMDKLWRQALEHAKSEFSDAASGLERKYQAKLKELKQDGAEDQGELKQLREQCLRLLQDVERLSGEKRDISLELSAAENKLIVVTLENERLERQVKQADLLAGSGGKGIDDYIELRVENRSLADECARLKSQLEFEVSSKAELQRELSGAMQKIAVLEARGS
ncbi:DNA-binding protein [Neptuniibacter caesariensis]|uniref:Probable KrfA protein n=1 Tax=Neptuniibacter caesariensis TaxID=207954 RepID=A0A7U8C5S9_NEPCE|nr:DNA-binding protein [Neptuniibacter caesariensis]EAR62027.1 probable KrfA protein [Oceanospirillum sp. MED92] [Neptuniibacter caesariensis]